MLDFTVVTPTYNRANVLHRVYDSLSAQTYRNFEWIVVDDGSSDDTAQIVAEWQKEADFPISYFYQENSGKHMALNLAGEKANGRFFVIADSDDSFRAEALEILLTHWNNIPAEEQSDFRGVTCRCYDAETGAALGQGFPGGVHDVLGIDASFKLRYHFEMWGFNRTDVIREYPFPDTRGQGLSFYPETVIWNRMGLKYRVRFVNAPLRCYYRDQGNAATKFTRNRSRENIHLWEHYVNDMLGYFRYEPMKFIKAFVGLSMDGLQLGKSAKEIVGIPNTVFGKIMTVLFFPAGFALYMKRRTKNKNL